MNILIVNSSAQGDASVSTELSRDFVRQLQAVDEGARVMVRDIGSTPIPHLVADTVGAVRGAAETEAELRALALSDELVGELQDADLIVIGAPMYNFGIPSTLKAWIDRVAVAGKTFHYTENGPEGLATGKRMIVASGRGGIYGDSSPADFQEAYLRHTLGFLGVTDIEFVRAEGVAYSPQHRTDAMAGAHASISEPMAEAA